VSTDRKRCLVACDSAAGVRTCEVELAREASIAEALAAARRLLDVPGIDWERGATGIYGRVLPREHVPADGERVELYRSLLLDPRERRRQRSRARPSRS
jgi:putative ubiquitin-RnfH superfamily antitoxin RatB of RatAB toxin-antitoxin module